MCQTAQKNKVISQYKNKLRFNVFFIHNIFQTILAIYSIVLNEIGTFQMIMLNVRAKPPKGGMLATITNKTELNSYRCQWIGCWKKASPRHHSCHSIGWSQQRHSFRFIRNDSWREKHILGCAPSQH